MTIPRIMITILMSLVWVAAASALDVKLQWDPNSEPDLSGYKVYYWINYFSNSVQLDVKNQTVVTITGLDPGRNYSFAVTAYNTSRIEGPYSNVVTVLESVPPVVSAFTMPVTANSLTVAVSSFRASDANGVTGYLITESATAPAATLTAWQASAPVNFTFSGRGSKTAYAWAKDAAGNVSAGKSATVVIDLSPPEITTFTAVPSISLNFTVDIVLTATDNVAVTGYLINESTTPPDATAVNLATAPTSYTATTSGIKTLYAWARDAAGNVSLAKSATVVILPLASTLQIAYNIAADGAIILQHEGTIVGPFTANRAVTVTIKGGYNLLYTANPGYTVLKGKVTIQKGKVIFNKIRVR